MAPANARWDRRAPPLASIAATARGSGVRGRRKRAIRGDRKVEVAPTEETENAHTGFRSPSPPTRRPARLPAATARCEWRCRSRAGRPGPGSGRSAAARAPPSPPRRSATRRRSVVRFPRWLHERSRTRRRCACRNPDLSAGRRVMVSPFTRAPGPHRPARSRGRVDVLRPSCRGARPSVQWWCPHSLATTEDHHGHTNTPHDPLPPARHRRPLLDHPPPSGCSAPAAT